MPRQARPRSAVLRACGHGAKALVAVTLLVVLVIGAAIARLKHSPLPLDGLAERVSVALEQQFGEGYDVDVSHAELQWGSAAPVLAVTGVTIRDAKGNLVVAAPQADIAFDAMSLAGFSLVPKQISFVGLAVALTIEPDGSVMVSATGADDAVGERIVQPTTDTSFGPGALLDALAKDGPVKVLEKAGVRDGRLRINDKRRGVTALYEGVAIDFARAGNKGGLLTLHATAPTGPWSVSATVMGAPGAKRTARLDIANLSLAQVIGLAQPGAVPFSTEMTVNGHLAVTVAPDNTVVDVDGALRGGSAMVIYDDPDADPLFVDAVHLQLGWDLGEHSLLVRDLSLKAGDTAWHMAGRVTPPASGADHWQIALNSTAPGAIAAEGANEAPIPVERVGVKARIPLGLGGLVLDEVSLNGRDLDIQASGSLGKVADFEGLAVSVTAGRMPVRNLLAFWPSLVVPDVRSYLVDATRGGWAERFSYKGQFTPQVLADALAKKPIPDESVRVDLAVSNAAARFAPGLPLVTDLDITGYVTGKRVALQAARGTVQLPAQRGIALRNGRFDIADTSHHPAVATIAFDAGGSADATLELLRNDALKAYAPLRPDGVAVKGGVDARVQVTMPLVDNPPPAEVVVQVQGNANNISADNLFGKDRLEGGNFVIVQDRSGFSLRGDGRLNGTPAAFDMRQPAGGPGELTVAMTLDEAARARRGLKLAPQLTGPVDVKATVKDLAAPKPVPRLEVDLTKATINDLLPAWNKPAGRAGKASFRIDAGDDGASIDDLVLESGSVSVRGSLRLNGEGTVMSAKLSSLKLSPGDDMRADYEKAGTGGKLTLRATTLDARPHIKALTSSGSVPSPGPGPGSAGSDIDLDIKAGAMTGLNGEVLSAVDGRIGLRNGDIRDFRLAGRFANSPVSGQVARTEAGAPGIVIESGDAGAFLRYFDIYRKMSGGTLLAQLDTTGQIMSGTLVVNRFSLVNEPALARVAAPDPNAGDGEATANAVAFTKLRAGFAVGGGKLTFRDATMWGPSVGGTLEGTMDFRNDRLDMSGTFVPAYGLNNAFNQVPIVGTILGGGQNEGLFGVNFRLTGRVSQPTLSVNPLSAVAPGILRKFFGVFGPQGVAPVGEPSETGASPAPPGGTPLRLR